VLPSLITTNGTSGIGSPTAVLTDALEHKRYFGTDSDDTLVARAALCSSTSARPCAIAPSSRLIQLPQPVSGTQLEDSLDFWTIPIDTAVDHARPLELPPRAGAFKAAYVDSSVGPSVGILHRHRAQKTQQLRPRRGARSRWSLDPQILTEDTQNCVSNTVAVAWSEINTPEWVSAHGVSVGSPRRPRSRRARPISRSHSGHKLGCAFPTIPLLRELGLLERMPTGWQRSSRTPKERA
jgi:hypothetical protein